MQNTRPLVAITLGDPCGIGPEVVAKALAHPDTGRLCLPLVIGNITVLEQAARLVQAPLRLRKVSAPSQAASEPGTVAVLDSQDLDPEAIRPGEVSAAAGRACVEWVLKAGELALAGGVRAVATAPINKEAAALAGYKDIGHMELYQRQSGSPQVATMLMAGPLRVVHLTTHRSLRRACDYVTLDNILSKLRLTHSTFQSWGFARPRIGVAALNPHASDGGLLGDEEKKAIAPAVEAARQEGMEASGPVPADSIFPLAARGNYDVVLCMYHDQGHIPVKVYDWERSVTVALGLPFIRTSVDHGTALDIAGKGVASETSMLEAIRVAASLASGQGLPT
ncbi:MAG: 4-hydroxythreonine-4-phosphate dehydrogenase PdxA [Chloroflexi bacterium]|nr:4-hydroxythreonine-4-phosphate dehydrogenase PdxA [Chloroflexota bacterium]